MFVDSITSLSLGESHYTNQQLMVSSSLGYMSYAVSYLLSITAPKRFRATSYNHWLYLVMRSLGQLSSSPWFPYPFIDLDSSPSHLFVYLVLHCWPTLMLNPTAKFAPSPRPNDSPNRTQPIFFESSLTRENAAEREILCWLLPSGDPPHRRLLKPCNMQSFICPAARRRMWDTPCPIVLRPAEK